MILSVPACSSVWLSLTCAGWTTARTAGTEITCTYPLQALLAAHTRRPSRFEAQSDAVGLIFSAKTNANAESSVGLMSMAGNGPTVLTTLTTDMGRILDGLHRTKIEGYSDFTLSLNIAAVRI
jgi:hypothetical protein